MTHEPDLRDPLDDLLAEVPAYVDVDASAAWRAGARRRARQRVRVLAVVLVAAIGASLLLGIAPEPGPPQPAGPGHGVTGYPQRIQKPWFPRRLPDRPGPLALVLGSGSGLLGETQDGHAWRVPDGSYNSSESATTLSPSGRWWGQLVDSTDHTGTFELRDLTTGRRVRFPEVGGSANPVERVTPDPFFLNPQSPAFWSPDERAVLAPVADRRRTAESGFSRMILGIDGSIRRIRLDLPDAASAQAAGWADDRSVVWVAEDSKSLVSLIVTDLDGTVLRTQRLSPSPTLRTTQWTGSVSPDGTTVAVKEEADGLVVSVDTFALSSGLRATRTMFTDGVYGCSLSWRGSSPLMPTFTGDSSTTRRGVVLTASSHRPLVVADPRLDGGCSVWAADALAGTPRGGLDADVFGTSQNPVAWWWRELTLGAVVLLAAAGLRVRRRRARRT